MPISRNEAADALRDIGQTQQRSARAHGYDVASPYFLLWGAIWFAAYGGTDFFPARTGTIWLVAVTGGMIASMAIGMRTKRAQGASRGFAWQWIAMFVATAAFVEATLLVMKPTRGEQVGAFIPLLIALYYAIAGIWMGTRMLLTGVAIGALTLVGFFYLPQHFALWMAVVGGGALALAGLWLRHA